MRTDRALAKPNRQRLVLSLVGRLRLGTQLELLAALRDRSGDDTLLVVAPDSAGAEAVARELG